MFSGLSKTQPEIAQLLNNIIQAGDFPASVLFSGHTCTSRMYAALSVAKALGSDLDSTIIISDRNHNYRISSALKLYRKSKNNASKMFLYDCVSTYLKQFHGALMESQSATNRKKFSDAGDCMDTLNELLQADENSAEAIANKLEKDISALIDITKAPTFAKSGAITVNQVRDIRDFCSTSSLDGKAKVIIIEGLENASEGASNALLKTLEEPPKDTHFILISSNPGRIAQTILSRVRSFKFKDFTDNEKNYVLNSLFVDPKNYTDLDDFFLSYSGVNDALIKNCASALVNKQDFDLVALVKELEKTQAWDRFFDLVLFNLNNNFEKGLISQRICSYLCSEINNMVSKGKAFNQTRRLTFDFVLFRTKEILS